MTASSRQADNCAVAGYGRALLPIMTTTSKTSSNICNFNTEINSKNPSQHRPLWRKQRQKYYFLSIINHGQWATVEKFGPEVPYQWLLLVENINSIPIWKKYFAGRQS